MSFRPRPKFKLFLERCSLITHLPPDHWGANPCKKHAGDLREPAETLQKSIPWHQKSKPSRKLRSNLFLFWTLFGVATPQPSGSNPDRSPVAQWLNMRISPASRGPLQTRACPGVGGKPRAAGKVFRNHDTLQDRSPEAATLTVAR